MFNFSEDDFVPGFRVRDPKDDIPGFRVGPDGSTLQNPADILAAVRRYLVPGDWMTQGAPSNQPTNLAFGLGGGLSGAAEAPTGPLPPARLPYFEPAPGGDFTCQGECSKVGDGVMTGAYREGRDVLCAKCIVKRLGYESVPSSE